MVNEEYKAIIGHFEPVAHGSIRVEDVRHFPRLRRDVGGDCSIDICRGDRVRRSINYSRKEGYGMKPLILIQSVFSIIVIVIGIFMLVKYAGAVLPPALSGVAFILIGIVLLIKK